MSERLKDFPFCCFCQGDLTRSQSEKNQLRALICVGETDGKPDNLKTAGLVIAHVWCTLPVSSNSFNQWPTQ